MNRDEALDIFRGWRDSRARLSVLTVEDGKTNTILCSVSEVGDSLVLLKTENGSDVNVDLSDALKFEYKDVREAANPRKAAQSFVCALEIGWRDNSRSRFLEIRTDFDLTES